MNIKRIRTKRNHKVVLRKIEHLMPAKHNTPDGDRLDTLARLVEDYEKGELKSVATKSELARLKAAARATRTKSHANKRRSS
jgi:antitoxin component HigA of HigAB toxin-antitoxin module